jgi:hypothetical protein
MSSSSCQQTYQVILLENEKSLLQAQPSSLG